MTRRKKSEENPAPSWTRADVFTYGSRGGLSAMVAKRFKQFHEQVRAGGLRSAARRTREFLKREIGIGADKRRIELSRELNATFSGTVAYGLFKGLKLSEQAAG